MPKIALNHHCMTRPFRSAVDAMLPFLYEPKGELELLAAFNKNQASILESLGAAPEDRFFFFHSGSQAIEHLYFSHYFEHVRHSGKNHILTANNEGPSVMMPLKRLTELGCHAKFLPVNAQGQLTKRILEEGLNPRVSLVSLSWANGLTGVIHPIADLAEVCRENDILLHVDVSYAIGKLHFRFEDYPHCIMTFDGSFMHASQGTAGLIIKAKEPFSAPPSPLAGGMASLACALEENARTFDHVCLETARLRDQLEKGIKQGFPEAHVLFQNVERLPNCTCIAFPGVDSEALLFLLHRKGLGATHQSLLPTLISAGVNEHLARCALSFSLSYETSEQEIATATSIIVECAHKLKALSDNLLEATP